MWNLRARQQDILNTAIASNYRAALASADYQHSLAWRAQDICCDAFAIRYMPENIRCCVLEFSCRR